MACAWENFLYAANGKTIVLLVLAPPTLSSSLFLGDRPRMNEGNLIRKSPGYMVKEQKVTVREREGRCTDVEKCRRQV